MTNAHRSGRAATLVCVLAAVLAMCTGPVPSAFAVTANVTLLSSGLYGQSKADSSNARISADGRYVVFETTASLVPTADGNTTSDVYRRLLPNGTAELVSVAAGSTSAANRDSHTPAVSRDGRYVVFVSRASDIATGTASGPGTYVRDMTNHTTMRVDMPENGQAPSGWNASDTSSSWWYPAISADGSHIAFVSGDPALRHEGNGNGRQQVYVRTRATSEVREVSVSTSDVEGSTPSRYPSISDDGMKVAFMSGASNLVDNDVNGKADVFVHDLAAGTTTLVSVATSVATGGVVQGNQSSGWPAISGDGRSVAFVSAATNLDLRDTNPYQDVFVRSLVTSTTVGVSLSATDTAAGLGAYYPSISANGRYVAFQSDIKGLAGGTSWSAAFVFDMTAGKPTRIGAEPTQQSGGSLTPGTGVTDSCTSISADGRYVVFDSSASDLVANDTNDHRDVFLYDQFPQARPTVLRPKLSVTSPYRNRTFYVSGTVSKPRASLGVRLYFYRKVGTAYTTYKYFKVTVPAGKTAYKVAVKLPYKGSWYVRAYRPADAAYYAMYSSSWTFKVR